MSHRRRAIIIGLCLFLLVVGAGYWWLTHSRQSEARQELNDLLSEPQSGLLQPTPPGNNPEPPEPSLPMLGFGWLEKQLQAAIGDQVKVEETEAAYRIRVPLSRPEDAQSVQVNSSSNAIEISGQIGGQSGNTSVQRSFMQRFSTTSPILPRKMTRKTQKNGQQLELVVTIPKQKAGALDSQKAPDTLNELLPPAGHPSEMPPPALNDEEPMSGRVI